MKHSLRGMLLHHKLYVLTDTSVEGNEYTWILAVR
jgi:hypothetical protein